MEYSKERMDDLMRAYDEYISSCDYIRMSEVYKIIVNMPSRRFWVSDIRAALIISELCAKVIAQPAPKFYLTPGSAKVMVCKARKQWIQEKWKRLRLL